MRRLALCSFCIVACCGCSDLSPSASSPSTLHPDAAQPSALSTHLEACDPLAPHELPTKLENVIAAGSDTDGTVYVADQPPGLRDRVFVSRGDTLYRVTSTGAGSSGTADFTWGFEQDGVYQRLVAHKEGEKVTGIALASPDQRTFFDELDASAHRLTPVDPASLARFSVRNLLGEIEVVVAAEGMDGARIVVTLPKDALGDEDYRVFYGTNGRLLERVSHFKGAMSYLAFDFIVDGATWYVRFESVFAPGFETSIDTGAYNFPLTLLKVPVPVPGDAFECIVTD